MGLFDDMRADLGDENTMAIPGSYPVKCYICDWVGKYQDCPLEEEQDGWEMPIYQVPVCPKCREGIEV
jgi:NAD-dependent SIR2 family protein deacetylase